MLGDRDVGLLRPCEHADTQLADELQRYVHRQPHCLRGCPRLDRRQQFGLAGGGNGERAVVTVYQDMPAKVPARHAESVRHG
ncbi:hypothetical protein SBA4_220010 [Candidatus Sulfopaludibacter sp. SbA4]|nr:hypothetical protein SBA4_220010 [Candidatus Sulfopaludibacter sp. SbA4]